MELNLETLVPLILQNIDRLGTLCSYSAPCAIGLAFTPDQRRYLDDHVFDHPTIGHAIDQGVVTCPEDQIFAIRTIQYKHDLWAGGEITREDFLDAIRGL